MTAIRKLDLAHEMGVGKSAVSAWLRRGLPVQPNGLIDREAALEWINKNVEPQIGSRRLKGGAKAGSLLRQAERGDRANGNGHDAALLDPAQERARRDRAMAVRLERENEIARGELVRVVDVAAQLAGEYSIVRNKLLSLPSRLAPRLQVAAGGGPEAIRGLLYTEICAALAALATGDAEPADDAA